MAILLEDAGKEEAGWAWGSALATPEGRMPTCSIQAPCKLWALRSDPYKTCFTAYLMDGRTETGSLDWLKVTA